MKIKKYLKNISKDNEYLSGNTNSKNIIINNKNNNHHYLYMNSYKNKIKKNNFLYNNIKPTLTISSFNNTTPNKKFFLSKSNGNKIQNKNMCSQEKNPFIHKTNSLLSKINSQFNSISINNKNHNHNHNTISNINNKMSLRNKIFPKKNKNFINFVDRNKIRNINLVSLKLFDDYLKENNASLIINEKKKTLSPKKRESILYKDIKRNSVKANFISSKNVISNIENDLEKKISNLEKENRNNYEVNKNNIFLIKTRNQLKNVRKQFTLHQLMEFNPYHYVSNIVKYSNSIQMKKISETLGNIHGADFNIKATSQRHFFRGQSYKNKIAKTNQTNNRVINSFQVTFNSNISHKSGLVWRILLKFKLKRNNIIPSFRQACKFKAYSELWKYDSLLIEKLLVNYNEFKWFFEKEKYIKEEVFNEFLECKKMQEEIKGEISFSKKVFLAFDDLDSGEINIKNFFLIMEITSKSNNNLEKINFISNLVESYEYRHEEKSVNLFDMYELFKCFILYENSQKDSRYLYESIKEDLNNGEKIEDNIYVTKNDVCNFLLNNKFIHKLIQGFKILYKYANINYIEEINSCFNSTVRNVKKFLNEQNEVMCDSDNNYHKFEQVLKSIQNKNFKKEKTKKIEEEFENDINDETFEE